MNCPRETTPEELAARALTPTERMRLYVRLNEKFPHVRIADATGLWRAMDDGERQFCVTALLKFDARMLKRMK